MIYCCLVKILFTSEGGHNTLCEVLSCRLDFSRWKLITNCAIFLRNICGHLRYSASFQIFLWTSLSKYIVDSKIILFRQPKYEDILRYNRGCLLHFLDHSLSNFLSEIGYSFCGFLWLNIASPTKCQYTT